MNDLVKDVQSDLLTMDDYRQHLRNVTTIHTESVRRLIADHAIAPLDMAAMLEDMANVYLDLSDGIRVMALGRQTAAPV